jgi:peptidoglycan hydrolase-like protein with peptidoglycan-binding domain
MTGSDVKLLQQYLNTHGFPVSLTGVGSLGKESTYFGPGTRNAVIFFQEAHKAEILTPAGLTKGNGFFGPASRRYAEGNP